MTTGAESPSKVTHTFVLNGFQWAWAMLEGEKEIPDDNEDDYPTSIKSKGIENRHCRLAPGYYGVILGKGKKGATQDNYDMVKKLLPNMKMPIRSCGLKHFRGCVVGVVKVEHALPYDWCKDSPWANGMPVCNIISEAGWLDKYIPCKGNLGACPIEEGETLNRVRFWAEKAQNDNNIFKTGADVKYPYNEEAWNKGKKKRKAPVSEDPKQFTELSQLFEKSQNKFLKTGRESPA